MKNGVPFQTVFECDTLTEYERVAMSVTFSEFEGAGEFDWGSLTFRKRDE